VDPTPEVRALYTQTDEITMTDFMTDRSTAFRPSLSTDALRPAMLAAGTQMVISLLGAVLLTSGVLA
jgi:hypothetical protein